MKSWSSKLSYDVSHIMIIIQCLQSSRSQVGGSNPDSSVEEKFQKTLNPWTGRSQLLPETFKFELRPVWWGAGTERHSPPSSSSLAGGILILSAGFVLFSTVVFLGDLEIYFFVPVSGQWGSCQDGWRGGPGRQIGWQGRYKGGGRCARKHASRCYVHSPVDG